MYHLKQIKKIFLEGGSPTLKRITKCLTSEKDKLTGNAFLESRICNFVRRLNLWKCKRFTIMFQLRTDMSVLLLFFQILFHPEPLNVESWLQYYSISFCPPGITCSKLAIKTLERRQCQCFTTCSGVSIVNFGHVIVCWVACKEESYISHVWLTNVETLSNISLLKVNYRNILQCIANQMTDF